MFLNAINLEAHFDRLAQLLIPSQVVVRSDENGSRKRTIFCRKLSNALHRLTGQWHDAEVEQLCGITFNCSAGVEIDA